MPQYQATIRTYATSANLGPLFDRAGAKLEGLQMTTSGSLTREPGLAITSEGQFPVPTDKSNIAHKVAAAMWKDCKLEGGLALAISNNMKAGGLGTSGAGSVAVVELVNYLHQLHLTTEQKIKYASLGEPNQHLDNVVPCIVGGIVLATKLKGEEMPRYSKITPHQTLAYAVVIPADIVKTGGTTKAREVVKALQFTNDELVGASGLAELMIAGLIEGNFEKVRSAIKTYSEWEKSVTFVRNLPTEDNPNGVYGIDVNAINSGLERAFGKEAVLTPSGAGPAMLVIAAGKEAAKSASSEVVRMYVEKGHTVTGFPVSVRTAASGEDFV